MSIAVPSTSEDNITGVEIYSPGREYTGDGDDCSRSGGDTKQRKGGDGEGGEEVEGGLSTPPLGLGGKEVTRVLDTPHAHDKQKSKFNDGRSLLEETQEEESTFVGFEPTPDETARRLFNDRGEENKPGTGERMVLDDDDVTGDEDEDEDVISTMPADPATLPRSDTSGVSAPVSFIGTLPPSSGGAGVGSPVEGELLIAKPTPAREGGEGGQEEESGSLPEAFDGAQEIKRLRHTPAGVKTYGHRRGTPGHRKKQEKVEAEEMEEEKESPMPKSPPRPQRGGVQGNSNTIAKTNVKGNGKRKGKAAERGIEESSRPAKEEKEQEDMDIDEVVKEKGLEASQTVGRRPRLKHPRKEATTTTPGKRKRGLMKKVEVAESADEDEVRLEEEVEAEDIVEEVIGGVQSARKKMAKGKGKGKEDEKKENRKPPKKKARTTSGKAEKEDKGMNTQYTFYGSDEEVKEEGSENEKEDPQPPPPPPVKTPAKRGRKSTALAGDTINTPAKLSVIPPSVPTSPNYAPKTSPPYSGPAPKIVFSNSTFPDRKDATAILRALGVKKAHKVTEKGVTHLVVGSGGLVRSRYIHPSPSHGVANH